MENTNDGFTLGNGEAPKVLRMMPIRTWTLRILASGFIALSLILTSLSNAFAYEYLNCVSVADSKVIVGDEVEPILNLVRNVDVRVTLKNICPNVSSFQFEEYSISVALGSGIAYPPIKLWGLKTSGTQYNFKFHAVRQGAQKPILTIASPTFKNTIEESYRQIDLPLSIIKVKSPKQTKITCIKGKKIKTVLGVRSTCPKNWRKK